MIKKKKKKKIWLILKVPRNFVADNILNLFFFIIRENKSWPFFIFFIWVLQPFQEYFTYIEPTFHQRWAKAGEPGEKPPDNP